ELGLRRRLDGEPAELGQVTGAAHPRRRRREQRLRAEQVAERLLGLAVDLPDEKRVRADLAAEIRQRRGDERRSALPLAVPLLIERGVELAAPGWQERAGA